MSTTPAVPDPEVDRPVEYRTVECHEPLDVASLDDLGRRRWRLAAVVRYGGVLVYHFLRPAESPSRSGGDRVE
jgi:hypothetical protein